MNELNSFSGLFYECQNHKCSFRFPAVEHEQSKVNCPICGSKTIKSESIDLTKDIRINNRYRSSLEIIAVLDNIRSVYNTAAIFRTAVGFGIKKVYLCGYTPTPKHRKFFKTNLGAENSIAWQKSLNCVTQCKSLKDLGYLLLGIESSIYSIPLTDLEINKSSDAKIAFVVGNEIVGIDPQVLSICDQVASIPIIGNNKSFNVTIAFGIAAFYLSTTNSA